MKTVQVMMFALLVMAAGCKEGNDKALLWSHEWQLKQMVAGGDTVQNPQGLPEITFTDSTAIYGSAGCNRFFGTYTADDKGMMTIQPGGSTMMYCPDMQFEDRYLKALAEVAGYTVTSEELKITNADKTLTLIYVPKDTVRLVGVANDAHGCNAAAGYTWSEVRQNCIRLFEDGVKFAASNGQDSTLAAYVVFAADSLKAEVFMPENEVHPVLDRRELPKGGYTWNQEDDDTFNVRMLNGKWVIEQRATVLYTQDSE